MKTQLLSPSSFLRLPLIAWNAPPAIISDMSGTELLGLFAGARDRRARRRRSAATRPGRSRCPTAKKA